MGEDDDGEKLIAASITVTRSEGETNVSVGGQTYAYTGLHTQIKWYFPHLDGGNYRKTVTYKALVDMQLSGVTYTIGNGVWMNDKPGSRIYDFLWGGGTIIDYDKEIVTERGATPAGDTVEEDGHTSVSSGETVLYNLWDDWRAERAAEAALRALSESLDTEAQEEGEENPAYSPKLPDPDREMPTVEIDGYQYIGVLEIPALQLALPVIGDWSYPALKEAPCRYAGTAYAGGFVIAGHNYRTHFNPLKNLAPGNEVIFTDVEGTVFSYTAEEIVVLEPQEIEKMISLDWDLTLFTCTYGGQARLTVRCTRDREAAFGQEQRKGSGEHGETAVANQNVSENTVSLFACVL